MRPQRSDGPQPQYGFPRVSGDAPLNAVLRPDTKTFSPRERGCARFLAHPARRAGGFPRVSGDAPDGATPCPHGQRFSPRERGCAPPYKASRATLPVFPA